MRKVFGGQGCDVFLARSYEGSCDTERQNSTLKFVVSLDTDVGGIASFAPSPEIKDCVGFDVFMLHLYIVR